jgi:hypothetical protein
MRKIATVVGNAFPAVNIVPDIVSARYDMKSKPFFRVVPPSSDRELIRVGFLTYQLSDTPSGNLFRLLLRRLQMAYQYPQHGGDASQRRQRATSVGAGASAAATAYKVSRNALIARRAVAMPRFRALVFMAYVCPACLSCTVVSPLSVGLPPPSFSMSCGSCPHCYVVIVYRCAR